MHSDFTVNARRPCPFPESHHKDIPRPLPQHYRELASAMAPTMTRPGPDAVHTVPQSVAARLRRAPAWPPP